MASVRAEDRYCTREAFLIGGTDFDPPERESLTW